MVIWSVEIENILQGSHATQVYENMNFEGNAGNTENLARISCSKVHSTSEPTISAVIHETEINNECVRATHV